MRVIGSEITAGMFPISIVSVAAAIGEKFTNFSCIQPSLLYSLGNHHLQHGKDATRLVFYNMFDFQTLLDQQLTEQLSEQRNNGPKFAFVEITCMGVEAAVQFWTANSPGEDTFQRK